MSGEIEATISALGGGGDGIVDVDGERYFVPLAAPGDRVAFQPGRRVEGGAQATDVRLLQPGPARRAPDCPHFGTCGGCVAQHLSAETYRALKRDRVEVALRRRGVDVPVVEPLSVATGSRRRLRLTAIQRRDRPPILGFSERRSNRIVDISVCPVAIPVLANLLEPLRTLLAVADFGGNRTAVTVTETQAGIDLDIAAENEPSLDMRQDLAVFAETHDLARVVWGDETVLVRRQPVHHAGPVPVDVPPGAFLQPTEVGEAFLRDAVVAALSDRTRLADLFSGVGTFALPLAAGGARVYAAEGTRPSIEALQTAARANGLDGRIEGEVRDLDRRPLAGKKLAALDGLVLDPPRSGARAQAEAIAENGPERVVYVSCNPNTFARDTRIMIDGGYALGDVQPVDQFLWSAEIELFGIFDRT